MKSNTAVREELDRMMAQLKLPTEPCCPNDSCRNHDLGVISNESEYYRFGLTKGGSQRYKCKICGKLFSQAQRSTLRQRDTTINEQIFKQLVNKSPMRRICEIVDINAETLYQRIDFLAEQCRLYSAYQERSLSSMEIPRLNIAIDKQEYVINWTTNKDRRNVTLNAVASSDLNSSYVFGMHLNFDPNLDRDSIEADALALNDFASDRPFRKYARLWLDADHKSDVRANRKAQRASLRARKRAQGKSTNTLQDEIEQTYDDNLIRDDVEVSDEQDKDTRLPSKGLAIHTEYTLYGHFFYLKHLFQNTGKVRFYLDQEPGIRGAFLSAFHSRVKERTADAFYVKIDKSLTVHQRNKATADAKARLDGLKLIHPTLEQSELELMLIQERISQMSTIGKWNDRWMSHPFPNGGEPDKAVCYLTDYGDYAPEQLARLYQRASLHSIDRYFMLLRRRLNILERPIQTASAARRAWYGYSAYNPEIPAKLHVIFRAYYNYMFVGKDKKTPAMRLGLATQKSSYDDIVNFVPPI